MPRPKLRRADRLYNRGMVAQQRGNRVAGEAGVAIADDTKMSSKPSMPHRGARPRQPAFHEERNWDQACDQQRQHGNDINIRQVRCVRLNHRLHLCPGMIG
jgi:hypothetical protein